MHTLSGHFHLGRMLVFWYARVIVCVRLGCLCLRGHVIARGRRAEDKFLCSLEHLLRPSDRIPRPTPVLYYLKDGKGTSRRAEEMG